MKRELMLLVVCGVGLVAQPSRTSKAACPGNATFPVTYVEPTVVHCNCGNNVALMRPTSFGTNINIPGITSDLDVDTRVDGVTLTTGGCSASVSPNEDQDEDDVFETIGQALQCTTTGGTIYLMASGPYREALTVTDSVNIIGYPQGAKAILEGAASCFSGQLTRGIDITGSGKVVYVDNLTIQNYSAEGIRCADSDLRVTGSRIRFNDEGIDAPTQGGTLDVEDTEIFRNASEGIINTDSADWTISRCRISHNDYGLRIVNAASTANVVVQDSEISRSATDGINVVYTSGVVKLDIIDSRITSNANDGMSITGVGGTSESGWTATGTLFAQNAVDGIFSKDNRGCGNPTPDFRGTLKDCQIVHNGDDGIELQGTGTACSPFPSAPSPAGLSVYLCTISQNGGTGIDDTTITFLQCELGRNQFSGNPPEVGATCTTGVNDSKNQL